ncbi:glycosylase [Saitozyma sp. JCM 24511]|nr:glycosylase [Saitozyma sp. JCM 24511]
MLRQHLASTLLASLALLCLLPATSAQSTCNATSKCPSSAPCCSEYGYCGSGEYCLGGCEPMYSYALTSCKPDPICKSQTSTFYNLNKVWLNGSTYNGNASAYDWVVNSGKVIATDYGTKLVLNQTNGGTKISSTRYVHYGTIDFVLETSKWAGVVTAAITMSDVKDEIDWEFPGANTTSGQTNFWFLGIANYSATRGQTVTVSSDTSSNFHTYTLDWQPETLTWKIDGSVVRTVYKNETLSGTQYKYPSTPSLIQISIWPAGINSSAQGTIDWAGGLIDWTDPDYTANGYFWNTIQSVNVTCASEANVSAATTGWVYTGVDADQVPVVAVTNASTLLSGANPSALVGSSWTVALGGLMTAALATALLL